jgi:hypothetical protein
MNEMAIGDPPTNLNSLLGAIPDIWRYVSRDEAQAEMARQLAQAQTNNHMAAAQQAQFPSPSLSPPPPAQTHTNTQALADRAREMFLKRMGGIRAEMKLAPGDFLMCHTYNDQVYVFYCFAGREGVVKESIDLFPSDQLITQFRLVLT